MFLHLRTSRRSDHLANAQSRALRRRDGLKWLLLVVVVVIVVVVVVVDDDDVVYVVFLTNLENFVRVREP